MGRALPGAVSSEMNVAFGAARLFVAVWPPAEVRDALARLVRPATPGVRYTTPEQWHVTLRFLGRCAVRDAVAALARVRAPIVTAELGSTIDRLGRDALVVPVDGLDALAGAVRAATAQIGEPLDPRPFTGHLTIARLRSRSAPVDLAGPVAAVRWPVRQITLVQSDTRPEGARYTTIVTVPLLPRD